MSLLTSKQFLSAVSVVELDELLRPKIAIQMGKDAGLLNLQNSSLICSKMLRAMLKYEPLLLVANVLICKVTNPGSLVCKFLIMLWT